LRRLLHGTGLELQTVSDEPLVLVLESTSRTRRTAEGAHGNSTASPVTTPPLPAEHPTIVIQSESIRGDVTNLPEVEEILFTREDIEQSGFATPADLLITLPQNFGGGPNENTSRGSAAETNSGSGSGVNLRGLSDGGTIVLLNGRRLAPSGTIGGFTDTANIPLSAIDHMEVYPEGATARYGVDAIGGIVNFVLKQDTGFETGGQWADWRRAQAISNASINPPAPIGTRGNCSPCLNTMSTMRFLRIDVGWRRAI
jgi:iron complex outermembrane recepter protein